MTKMLYRIVGIRRAGYRAWILLENMMLKNSQTPVIAIENVRSLVMIKQHEHY